MRSILVALAVGLAVGTARAESCKVALNGEVFEARCKRFESWAIPLQSSGGEPKVRSLERAPKNEKHWVLVYESGMAGTRARYRMIRALVLGEAPRAVLAEAPWAYESVDGAPKLKTPEWKWSPKALKVEDAEFGENLDLVLPTVAPE